MKIKNEEITTFLTKVKCNTEFNDEDMLLNFTESGMKVNILNACRTVVLTGQLSKSAFMEYEQLGKIGIQKLGDIISILRTFGTEVELGVQGNILTIKEKGRKVEFELVDISTILEAPELKKEMSFTENIGLMGKDVNAFLADAGMNKEFCTYIATEKGKIIFNNSGRYKFTKEIETADCVGGNKLKLGEPVVNVLKAFSGNIIVGLGDGMPMKLIEKTENSNLSIIIAPMEWDKA